MNFDNFAEIERLDSLNMLGEINKLPNQLQQAWEAGQTKPLPPKENFRAIVISGLGGSAIGADLLAQYVMPQIAIPVIVHRDYGLPAFASGRQTLVICSSHSGNTEETLDVFDNAVKNDCSIMVICTGGKLAERARENGLAVWQFDHEGQPRAAVGFSFGLLLALFARLELIPDPAEEVARAVSSMKALQSQLGVEVSAAKNPAKRYAGQLVNRWVTVMGAGMLAPVARRWKGQINEIAKAGANFEFLPEANHNTLAGTLNPEKVLNSHTMTMFLQSPSDHPRNRLRSALTRQSYMLEGLNTDFIEATGDSPLSHMWTLILFGDYMAFYLAIAYGVDPTPIDALVSFKQSMATEK